MEKSTALLILGLNEEQLNIEEIDKAYNDALGQFSEELLNDAKNCLIKELNYNNEKDIRKNIRELTDTLDYLKKEVEEVSELFYTLKSNYETYKKDSKKPRSVFIDKNTRREQIADYLKILNSNADSLLNQITLPDTPKQKFEELKERRNAILSVIKKYENELNALDYIIKRENNNDFPEPLNIISEQALEEKKEQENNIEENQVEEHITEDEVKDAFTIDNKEDINKNEDIHEIFSENNEEVKEDNEEQNIDINWSFDDTLEPQNISEELKSSQPIDDNKETEEKGEFTWTFNESQVNEEPKTKEETPINTDTPNDIDDYTYEEGPVEDKPTVLKSTGYIITKSYQTNIKNNKDYYSLQKDNNKIKTKPFNFIAKLKEKITKVKMNKKISSIIGILREKSTELYTDYLKIEKIKDVIDSLGEGSIQKEAYENLIESIYNGKQNKIDYLEYAASALDEFANTNPNIKEDTQRMIAYELPTELKDFNVDDAIVENTYQGNLENPNYTNDVVAFDGFIKNINNIKRINNNEQQKTL